MSAIAGSTVYEYILVVVVVIVVVVVRIILLKEKFNTS